MKDMDKKLKEALGSEEAEIFEMLSETSFKNGLTELFRGKRRWITNIYVVSMVAMTILAVVFGYQFFQVESTRGMFAWGAASAMSLLSLAFIEIWFWMEMNRNAITREIKRLELQITALIKILAKED